MSPRMTRHYTCAITNERTVIPYSNLARSYDNITVT